MRRLIYALIFATLSAAPAFADEFPPLCTALHGVDDEARRTGEPQRIWSGVDFAAPAPCRAVTDNAATRAFCDMAAHESGLAYRLLACVANFADEPGVTTRRQHAEGRSRDAITHLTGRQAHGVRVDLTEAGDHYDIVVWSPK
ncbi:hypothetical protein [Phenylobacterium sp.]|uniref:hypothetical protein n=1 Tax=Phenylobacterium sp. TaxID=1871053 RepID=UPI002C8B1F8B|nr:hypothetical protein [Phenylobacterium sp.]HLZ74565.1 hypothetical protein [Phenylobacterium sp.]